jgi:hypothetical protein
MAHVSNYILGVLCKILCINVKINVQCFRDVYVVELDAGAKGSRPNRGPLPVLIQLQGEGIRPVPRNVTLILKSHQPIRWQFGANGINGNIVVVVSVIVRQHT